MKTIPKCYQRHKIFVLILFFCLLSTGLKAQNVTLNVSNTPLKAVLSEITTQTGIPFMYSNVLEGIQNPVTYKCTNQDINTVLNSILGDKITYKMFDGKIALAPIEQAAPVSKKKISVRGTIIDATTSEPIAGAVVMIQGTTKYVMSSDNGQYSIEAATGDILNVSIIGMETQNVTVRNSSVINIELKPDVISLDDVVVTGYQTLSKERATGSFDNVGPKLLDKPQVSIESSLIGNVAGLQIIDRGYRDREEQIVIRGLTSLGSNAAPLIVVDGFAIEGTLSSLNPNDIASISVLKDAAAASIWGARSANGVIVVTTKKGQKNKVDVELNAFVKMSDYFDLDYANPLASSAETVEYEKLGFKTKYFNEGSYLANNYSTSIYNRNYRLYSQACVLMNENRLGFISDSDMNSGLEKLANQDNRDQIRKYLLNRPLTQQYNLSISGASERMNNALSLMFEDNIGSFKGNKDAKYTLNFRNTTSLYKWLDLSVSAMFQYTDEQENGISLSDIKDMSPYDMLVDDSGNYCNVQKNLYLPVIKRYITDKNVEFPYSDWTYNPLQEIRTRDITNKSMYGRFQAGLKFIIIPGLDFESKIQYEMMSAKYKAIYDEDSYQVRFYVNETSTWNGNASTPVTQNLPSGMALQENNSSLNAYNFRNQLSFDRTFKDKHAVSAIIGTEMSSRVYETYTGDKLYGYNDELLSVTAPLNGIATSTNVLYNMFGKMEYYNTIDYPSGSRTYNIDRYFSMYANASYTYDRKYTVSASARSDASNLITSDPSIRYSPFWSVGASWEMSRENFIKEISYIDRLAVRATYGFNGNVDKSTSLEPLMYVYGSSYYTGTSQGWLSSYGNPSLGWEKTGTFDLGVDYSLFGGKLFGKLDVYDKEGRDLISMVSIASAYGDDSQDINAISMYNRGIELSVGSSLKSGDFGWTGNLSFSYNKNKITKLYKDSGTLVNRVYGLGSGWEYAEGYDASTIWTFKYGGMQELNGKTQPVIVDKNGENPRGLTTYHIAFDSSDYLVSGGSSVAPYIVGFNNSFSYKNLSLSFIITGYFGHKFRRTSFNYPTMTSGNGNINKYYSEVLNCNPDELIPLLDFEAGESYPIYMQLYLDQLDNQICNAGNIRIQEINLTYNLSKRCANSIGIGGLSIYAQLNNVGVILFNKYGQDPLYPMGTVKPGMSCTLGFKFKF